MTFGKKILFGTVAALALVGQANAVEITNVTVGSTSIGTGSYTLASELALTTSAPAGTLVFDVRPTSGVLPSGNIVLKLDLTGAVFTTAVGGSIAVAATGTNTSCGPATSVLSSGGTAGSGSVTLILSGLNGCGDDAGEGVRVTLPVRVTGAVSADARFSTEANLDVDGGTATRSSIITFASAFAPTVTADTATTQLTIASGFKALAGDDVLGSVRVAPSTATVYSNLTGTSATNTANVTSVTVSVTGDSLVGFGTGTGSATMTIGGIAATISGNTASVTVTGTAAAAFTSASSIEVVPATGTSAAVLSASSFTASITAGYSTAAGFSTGTENASGTIDSIVREGTTIVFPWTASNATVTVSGSNNVIRIGNRSGTTITGLYARVVNTSAVGYTNPGLVSLSPLTIPANGEALIDSALLTSKLGEFARGDIEIVVEANPSDLTTRRLVVRPDGVFDWRSGAN